MRPEQLPIIDLQQICLVCHLKWRKYPGDKLLQKVATYCTEADFFDVFFKSKKIKSVKKRDKIKNTSPPLFYQIEIAPTLHISKKLSLLLGNCRSKIFQESALFMKLQSCPKRDSFNLCANREFYHIKGSLRWDFISRRIFDQQPLWALCLIAHEFQHSYITSFFPNLLDKKFNI